MRVSPARRRSSSWGRAPTPSRNGSTSFTVDLNYADETSDSTAILVPDWFSDPPPAPGYYLIDGRDRMQPGSGPGTPYLCENLNDPAIFGYRFNPDPLKTLVSVTVERTNISGVSHVFGATGVRFTSVGSVEANALIDRLLAQKAPEPKATAKPETDG